ncbi:MAG: hypothetical protein AB8C02_00225 [Halioglobus sp.]
MGFKQYNDHRVGATRLLVYGVYRVEGELNFHTLTLVANLALPLMLLLFFQAVKNNASRWIYLLVAALLLFNLKFYTLLLMSQAAFAYFWVVLYAFAAIFALHRVTVPKFFLAAVFCTLSSFSLASGQIAWLLGLVTLIHQSLLRKDRSFLFPLLWLFVSVAMLLVWRWGFVADIAQTPSKELLAILPDYVGNAQLAEKIQRYFTFFLAFTGSALVNFSALGASIAGLAMLTLLVYFSYKSLYESDIRLVLCCWFAVATLAAVTSGRALMVEPETVLHARYNFFSVVLLCPLVILTLVRFNVFRSYGAYIVVALSLGYAASTWREHQEPLRVGMSSLHDYFNRDLYPVAGKTRNPRGIVYEAIAAGVYIPPCRPYPVCTDAEGR